MALFSRNERGSDGGLQDAYKTYVGQQRLTNTKVGCLLVIFLMPAGTFLDYFVYRDQLADFFLLRIGASVIAALILASLYTDLGRRGLRWLGVVVPLIPVVSIAGMIAVREGFASPYYAGLNLVLLAVGAVLHWTVLESVVACGLVGIIYLAAGFLHGSIPPSPVLVNNFYFITLMDIIVIVGTYFAEKQREREFALRFQLDASRAQLEASNEKLKELDQIKGRFFANISHELRTPLTLMISPLETILARHRASLPGDMVGLLETMQSNGLRLLKLINDLLDLVRLESGVMQVRREAVAMEPFLQGLASAARQVAADKRIDLVVSVAPAVGAVMVDRDKLEKIVINLQFNALKFTPSGGRVELKVDREGDELLLRVSDTGIGIPAKDLPNMFSRFFQVDSSARRKYQGVGIGLALVKELTELHGGTVGVDSVEGQGTTFTVRMPYLAADEAAVAAATAERTAANARLTAPAGGGDSRAAMGASTSADAASGAGAGGTVSSQEWLSNLYHRANLFGGAAADKTAPVPALGGAGAGGKARGDKPFTALVADDQPDMLRFICSELAPHYNLVPVSDGQQAVDQAAAVLPDIVLLDMMMPEKDGIQACREIRAAPATRAVPIILITAHVDEDTKLNALRAGASDFLPKPFSTTELHVRVRNLVESLDFQRQLAKQNAALETTIEQLKDTETQLVQSEKLASLGRLSAGIIHEINNPLNFVTTGLFTLRAKARLLPDTEREDYAEILKDVEEGVVRVKSIVTDLRTFTHPGGQKLDEVNVAEVVNSSLRLLSQEWKDKVDVRLSVPDDQVVWAEKNRLIQVLVNLLQNSLDAVRAKAFADGGPMIEISGVVDGGLSRVVVRDNGQGIDPDVVDKVFDPFFTTKDVGQGMGLGLSICYRIVQDFEGRILVRSEQGKYCEFTLEFPGKAPQSVLQP